MHVPATLAVFAAVLALLMLVRFCWSRISRRFHILLVALACAALMAQGLTSLTKWGFASNLLRVELYWAAIAAYEFFILLLTLLRPKWLTTLFAIILILPLLSASVFLPLAAIFDRSPHRTAMLGDTFTSEITPWNSILQGTSGVDVDIFRHNRYLPFLQHRLTGVRLYNNQCNTSALVLKLQPDHRSVLLDCPAWPVQSSDTGSLTVLALP